jgi:hypothetical protein
MSKAQQIMREEQKAIYVQRTGESMKSQFLVQCFGFWGRGYSLADAARECKRTGAPSRETCIAYLFTHPDADPQPAVIDILSMTYRNGSTRYRLGKFTLSALLQSALLQSGEEA